MSSPDKAAGPQITQTVKYNNGGTVTAAIIYGVNANGTVNLVYFSSSGPATNASNVNYDPNLGVGKWAYPDFH